MDEIGNYCEVLVLLLSCFSFYQLGMNTVEIDGKLKGKNVVSASAQGFKVEDLQLDMWLRGTVRNVVEFGCFVDIGVGQDG